MKRIFTLGLLSFLMYFGLSAQGVTENFDDGDLSGWGGSADYSMTNTGTELRIATNKTSTWNSFTFSFPATDISANPYVSLKVKTNIDFNLNFFINSDQSYGNGSALSYQEIIHSDGYNEYIFDFSGAAAADLQGASLLNFVFNPAGAQGCTSTVYFDDLRIGGDAMIMPKISGIQDQHHPINSGMITVPFYGAKDIMTGGATLAVTASSSDPGLIPDPSVDFDPVSGSGTVSYTPVTDMTGTAMITLTVSGNAPTDNMLTFNVTVEANMAPIIDQADDQNVKAGEQTMISLSGLGDGDPNADQSLMISATSSNTSLLPDPTVVIGGDGFAAVLTCEPPLGQTGTATVTVTVQDDGGTVAGGVDTKTMNFDVSIFEDVNKPPAMNKLLDLSILQDDGEQVVDLNNITDGDDDKDQTVTITAVSSNPALIPDPTIDYTSGSSGKLMFTTVDGQIGTGMITVTLSDDGGAANNNGNESSVYTFNVEVRVKPITGWEDDFEDGILGPQWPADWGDPGEDTHKCTEMDGAMQIEIDKTRTNNKWAGLWFNIPTELDLSHDPYISITMKTDHPGKDMLIFLWDANDHYNTAKTVRHTVTGEYVEYYFDYSDPSFQLQSDGTPLDMSRIKALLINFDPGGASPLFQGSFFFEDFRVGDKAHRLASTPNVTMNSIPDFAIPTGSGQQDVTLSGLSDGGDGTNTVTLTATSNNTDLIPAPSVGAVSGDKATLSYTPAAGKTGSATIKVTASAEGSNSVEKSFTISVVTLNGVTASEVTINLANEHQTIDGFGAFMGSGDNSPDNIIDLARDMGMSMARFGVIGGGFEKINDNSDPYITDLDAYNANALSLENMRRLAPFVDKFIVTFWSPAGWMKKNKWENGVESYSTDNKLDPRYYQEYAEEVVAMCRIIKRETGKDVYAVGLQNEPQFNEPYPSCQVDWNEYRDIINVVGPRLEAEGLDVKLFWAEALPAQGRINDYINAVKNDPTAYQYADIVAIHNYDADGASVGGAGCSEWQSIYNRAQTAPGVYKTWMTETSGHPDSWSGAMTLAGNIFNALNCGSASGWVFWSFSVPEGASEFGLVVSNRPSSRYFISKQYYKFIRPGAIRVDATSDGIPVMAFKHNDTDSIAVVLFNNTNEVQTIEIKGKGLPSTWDSYTTSNSRNCEKGEGVGPDGLIVLPPSSLTTLVGSISNPAPNIDPLENLTIDQAAGEQNITLTGINDGAGFDQAITITASSDNSDLISDPVVTYTQGESTATLTFTPSTDMTGSAIVTVSLMDDGDPTGEHSEQFMVTVTSNPAPNIDAVDNQSVDKNSGLQTVNLTGIDDGDGYTQNITISASSNNTGLVPDPTVDYVQGESTATLSYTPVTDMTGDAVITVSVSDDGDPVQTSEVQFTITVNETDGIQDYQQKVALYPNPARDNLNVDLSGLQFDRLIVTDLTGRTVVDKSIKGFSTIYHLDVSSIEKGMYMMVLKNDSESLTLSFVIE